MADTALRAAAREAPARPRVPALVRTIARQAISVAFTLFGLLAITFTIGRLLPLDPVIAIIGDDAPQSTYDMVYKQLGLDKPLYEQFAIFVWNMMQGDFGNALFTGNRVAADLARVFPATIELATVALVMGATLGIGFGVAAAVYRGTLFDHLVRFIGLIGYSAPTFWLGLMGLVLFYSMLDWVGGPGQLDVGYIDLVEPITGMLLVDSILQDEWEVFWNAVSHIILPASILGYASTAYIARMTRSFMLEQLSQEYIIAARAKGMTGTRVVWRHAFPNILVQLVTVVALTYAFLLEGAVLTETVFAWPGFGRYLTLGLLAGDMNAVLASVLIIGLTFVGLNLLCDVLYRVLDPRTR
ncbi:MAG: ABC transporter permease [Thalassobaculales bacterium]